MKAEQEPKRQSEPTENSFTVSIDNKIVIGKDTLPEIGGFIDHHRTELGIFVTEVGTLLVDFSEYNQIYKDTEGRMGIVRVIGDSLVSTGHSAQRKNSDTLGGIRRIHTGDNLKGSEIIGKNIQGENKIISINLSR